MMIDQIKMHIINKYYNSKNRIRYAILLKNLKNYNQKKFKNYK